MGLHWLCFVYDTIPSDGVHLAERASIVLSLTDSRFEISLFLLSYGGDGDENMAEWNELDAVIMSPVADPVRLPHLLACEVCALGMGRCEGGEIGSPTLPDFAHSLLPYDILLYASRSFNVCH